jgi:uncharacterized membrane protein YdjX (TVP38/TMEM64 family)
VKNLSFPLIILIVVFCAAAGILTAVFWPFIMELRDPVYREQFSVWVKSLGVKGVFILLGIQILQIVVAVIPGGPVELIAGAAYGIFGGLAICAIGCAAATALIFFLVKTFGRSLVVRFFGEKNIASWKFLSNPRRTARMVFIVFLIPGMPKDMLTWFAPLSGLSLPLFTGISVFARLPAIVSTIIMGDSAIKGNWIVTLAMFALTACIGLAGLYLRDKIKFR